MNAIMFTMVKFPEWLDKQLEARQWTRAELARRAGVHQSTISMAYSGQRNVGPDLAEKIANAFAMPREEVYRAAGLLEPTDEADALIEELGHLLKMLTDDDLQEVIDYARHRLERKGPKSDQKQTSRGKSPARSALKRG